MTTGSLNPELVEIALDRVEGTPFERFVNSFYPAIEGIQFIPLGGYHDGGADAFVDSIFESSGKRGSFYQASIESDSAGKIRRKVKRLKDFGRTPKTLTYVTSRRIPHIDQQEDALSDELNVRVRIRDRGFLISHINHSSQTQAAYHHHLHQYTEFLRSLGSAVSLGLGRGGSHRSHESDLRLVKL